MALINGVEQDPNLAKQLSGQSPAVPAVTPVAQGVGSASPSGEAYAPTRTVDFGNETVQGQLKGLMDSESPFIQQAQTQAKQESNARGLINSSMAVTAGQDAAYRAALPVANADAQTYKSAGDINFGAQNQAGQARLNTALQEGSQARLAAHQSTLDEGRQARLANNQYNIESLLQQLKGAQAKELSQLDANYKVAMQSSDSAARLFTQSSSDIAKILADPNIPAENKQSQVDKQIQILQSGLAIIGGIGNMRLNDLLVFG